MTIQAILLTTNVITLAVLFMTNKYVDRLEKEFKQALQRENALRVANLMLMEEEEND